MDWDAIHAVLHAWAETATGATVWWEDQNQPRPEYPFLAMAVMRVTKLGSDEIIREFDAVEDTLTTTLRGNRVIRLRVQSFSDSQLPTASARAALDDLQNSIIKPSVRLALQAANIAVINTEPPRNVGRIIQGRSESRWLMNVKFSGAVNLVDTVTDYVRSVGLTGTVDDNTFGQTITDS